MTGSFDGESELHEALDAPGSGLEVVGWTSEVRDAVPYFASDDISAVLLGAGRDGDPVAAMLQTDVAVIRLHTQAPIVLLVPEAHPEPRRDGLQRRRRRCPRAAAAGRDDLVRDSQGARDRRAGQRLFGKRRRCSARPCRDGVLAEGRHRQDRALDESRGVPRAEHGQACPADRPRSAVRRRGDHARPRPHAHDARARPGSRRRSMPASSPATRRATSRGSTSSRRRCAPRTPSSSPSRRCCSCSRWPARPTTSSSSTPRRSSTGRCSQCCGRPTSCCSSAASTCRRSRT